MSSSLFCPTNTPNSFLEVCWSSSLIYWLGSYTSGCNSFSSSLNSSSLQSSRPARLQRGSVWEAVGHERGQRHGPRLPPGPAHLHRPEHRRLADQRTGEQVKTDKAPISWFSSYIYTTTKLSEGRTLVRLRPGKLNSFCDPLKSHQGPVGLQRPHFGMCRNIWTFVSEGRWTEPETWHLSQTVTVGELRRRLGARTRCWAFYPRFTLNLHRTKSAPPSAINQPHSEKIWNDGILSPYHLHLLGRKLIGSKCHRKAKQKSAIALKNMNSTLLVLFLKSNQCYFIYSTQKSNVNK